MSRGGRKQLAVSLPFRSSTFDGSCWMRTGLRKEYLSRYPCARTSCSMSSTLAWAVSIQPEERELANTTVLFLQADRNRRREARLYTCRQLCTLFAQIIRSLRSVLVRRCIVC